MERNTSCLLWDFYLSTPRGSPPDGSRTDKTRPFVSMKTRVKNEQTYGVGESLRFSDSSLCVFSRSSGSLPSSKFVPGEEDGAKKKFVKS